MTEVRTMPSRPSFRASRFGIVHNAQVHVSPLSGAVQTLELPGARWRASYTLPPMKRREAADWIAFLVRLRGQAGRFFGYDPDARTPQGTARSGAISIAGQKGSTLAVKGMVAGATLLAYDYVAFNTSRGRALHMVVEGVAADDNGNAVLVIEPPLRNPAAADEPLIFDTAACVMMLDSPETDWDADHASTYGLSFSAIEAIY